MTQDDREAFVSATTEKNRFKCDQMSNNYKPFSSERDKKNTLYVFNSISKQKISSAK